MSSSPFPDARPWTRQLATAALFLVPALGGTVQSGYSYGALLLLVGMLCTLHRWPRGHQDRWTWAFAAVLLGQAVYWYAVAPNGNDIGQWDRPAKFLLGAGCLLFVSRTAPLPRAQFWGLLVGCIGVGAVALWQVHVEGEPRASGFPTGRTNAIQWGNLALLLGTMLVLQAAALRRQLGRRVLALAAAAALMGFNASVLSGSRGGWLALLLAMPVALYLLWRVRPKAVVKVLAGVAIVVAVVGVANHAVLSQRWEVMEQEIKEYEASRTANNSVGQRLEHWRFAWNLGLERPVLGWGMQGYLDEKERRVAAGEYAPDIIQYLFTHNELLDVFVKTGLVGVLALLLFYAVPACMFWPTRARVAAYAAQPPQVRAQMMALRLAGLSIPLLYAGFGLTQVYFAHNSGIMPFVFLTTLTWAALRGMDARHLPTATAGAGASRA